MKNTLLTIAFAVASTTMFAAQNPPAKSTPAVTAPVATKKPAKVHKHSTKKPAGGTSTTSAAKPAPVVKPAPASK